MLHFNDVLEFGMYRGDTIDKVLDNDSKYLVWCIENVKGFVVSNEVYKELGKKVDLTNKMC